MAGGVKCVRLLDSEDSAGTGLRYCLPNGTIEATQPPVSVTLVSRRDTPCSRERDKHRSSSSTNCFVTHTVYSGCHLSALSETAAQWEQEGRLTAQGKPALPGLGQSLVTKVAVDESAKSGPGLWPQEAERGKN